MITIHEFDQNKSLYEIREANQEDDRWYELWAQFQGDSEFIRLTGDNSYTLSKEILRLATAEAALKILVLPLMECLRQADDFDGNALYELLAEAGITKRVPYDPQNLEHNPEWFSDGTEPGDEIWLLTDLGRELTEHPTLPPPQDD